MRVDIVHLGRSKDGGYDENDKGCFIVVTEMISQSKEFLNLKEAVKSATQIGESYNIPYIRLEGSTLPMKGWVWDGKKYVEHKKED